MSSPLAVTWNATLACNLKCVHCYTNAGKPMRNELSFNEIRKFLEEIAEMGVSDLFIGGGEPICRSDFFRICKYAIDLGLILHVCTNGTLFNHKIAAKMKEIGVETMLFGLDGASSETNDVFRGMEGAFDRTVNSIKVCKEIGLRTFIDFTCTRLNYKELPAMITLSLSLGIDGFHFKRFIPMGRGKSNAKMLLMDSQDYASVIGFLADQKMRLQHTIEIGAHEPLLTVQLAKSYPPHSFDLSEGRLCSRVRTSTCLAGSWIAVTPDGDVLPCPLLPLKLGNIRRQSLTEIWNNNSTIETLQHKHLLKGKCGACPYKYLCGGCRASACACYGNFLSQDPLCYF